MTAPTNAQEALDQATLGPKKVKVGNQEVEQHSVDDHIKATDRAAANIAATKPHFGCKFVKLVPPGGGQ